MVRKSAKGKVLGKDAKLQQISAARDAVKARRGRDDKRWKRVLAKMSSDKKAKYAATQKVARRGVTRRFLNARKERKPDSVAYECTIHLRKLLKGRTFNKRAPTAIKKIREFAQRLLRTKDNRIHDDLNKAVWAGGIKGCPTRLRVKIERKVDQNDKSKKMYSVITAVKDFKSAGDFKGQLTKAASQKK